ncbi:MAG: RNA polymerase sigma factor [Ktedonobacterales bacterium]
MVGIRIRAAKKPSPATERARGAAELTDAERFAAQVPPLVPAMLRAAAALVGPADAEDAAQEAITHAWQSWSTLRNTESLRPWLLRITVNICYQWHRGRFGTRLRHTEPLPETESAAFARLDADPGASDATAALDLRQAVNTLPDDLRIIVLLRYFGGMDASEVGAALGVPPATVRTRLRRALMTLRTQLRSPDDLNSMRGDEGHFHV